MRTVVNYVPNGFLDRGASATVTGSTDAESGLPIATGLTLGSFQEFNDAQALKYSSRGVNSVNILTAGSGQTPGTYHGHGERGWSGDAVSWSPVAAP